MGGGAKVWPPVNAKVTPELLLLLVMVSFPVEGEGGVVVVVGVVQLPP